MPEPPDADHRSRLVLVAAAVVLVLAALAIVWRLPRTTDPTGFAASSITPAETAVAQVRFQIDSIDAQHDAVSVRVSAIPGPAIPAEGVKILVGTDISHQLTVTPGVDSPVEAVVFDFDRGSVTAYPFDRYRLSVPVEAVAADSTAVPGTDGTRTLPIEVIGNSSAFGFEPAEAQVGEVTDQTHFDLTILMQRTLTHRLWASAMMAIFWALALAALTVAVAVAWRARGWETRHLAWLTGMVFALAAFRNTAPGGPPLGVFMDTAAFFWAEAIVVLSLVGMVVVFMTRRRDEIE